MFFTVPFMLNYSPIILRIILEYSVASKFPKLFQHNSLRPTYNIHTGGYIPKGRGNCCHHHYPEIALPQENRELLEVFFLPAWETHHFKEWYIQHFNIFKVKGVHTPNNSITKKKEQNQQQLSPQPPKCLL